MRLLPIAVLTCLGLVITGCDAFYDYKIDNRTDQQLLTWALLEDCSDEIGNRDEYLREVPVPPRTVASYGGSYSPYGAAVQCIQVATLDRRLVLSEPYHDADTYIVDDPLDPGAYVPENSELSPSSWRENVEEAWRTYLVLLLITLFFGTGILYGLYLAARAIYDQMKSNTTKP